MSHHEAVFGRLQNGFRSLCNDLAVADPAAIHRSPAPTMKFEGYDEAPTLFPIDFALGTSELPNWDGDSGIVPR